MKSCQQCSENFEITDKDQDFYKKISVPEPTLCPQCRFQRRTAFRNERNLYKRKCDLTGKDIISMYSPDKPFIIYNYKDWFSDKWDPMDYGIDFDFSKPFFEQFAELQQKVPKSSLRLPDSMENCDYCNYGGRAKDCYLCACPFESDKCLYSWTPVRSTEDIDGYANAYCKHSYECVYAMNCYETQYSDYSTNCSHSFFLLDCTSCKDCFGCINLNQKQYYFLNEKLTRKEYKKKAQSITGSYKNIQKFAQKFHVLASKHPRKHSRIKQSENCTGDIINGSKDCKSCFDVFSLEQSAYCYTGGEAHSLYDCNLAGVKASECYECIGVLSCNHVLFSTTATSNIDCAYCLYCINSQHCFGCEGLNRKKYCILNKQYSKEEYEELLPKIIEHMKKTKEYGEFFPVSISPFAYNESVAQEYFPLTKEEAVKKEWKWKDEEQLDVGIVTKKIPAKKLPDSIAEIPNDILHWAIECEKTGKLFKIVKPELEFYRKMNIPLPHLHPDVRYLKRFKKKNPYKLWKRKCEKCKKEIQTTYAPERSEIVHCEECYLAEVY